MSWVGHPLCSWAPSRASGLCAVTQMSWVGHPLCSWAPSRASGLYTVTQLGTLFPGRNHSRKLAFLDRSKPLTMKHLGTLQLGFLFLGLHRQLGSFSLLSYFGGCFLEKAFDKKPGNYLRLVFLDEIHLRGLASGYISPFQKRLFFKKP